MNEKEIIEVSDKFLKFVKKELKKEIGKELNEPTEALVKDLCILITRYINLKYNITRKRRKETKKDKEKQINYPIYY